MTKEAIIKKICEIKKCDESKIKYSSISSNGKSYAKIRDLLIVGAKIIEENKKDNYYIVTIEGGASSFANVAIIVCLDKDIIHIASYAEEGLIKQHIASKNLEKIESLLLEKPIKKKININIVAISIIACVLGLTLVTSFNKPKIDIDESNIVDNSNSVETNSDVKNDEIIEELNYKYNTAIENYNNIANAYNKIINNVSTINIKDMRDKAILLDKADFNETNFIEADKRITDLQNEIEKLLSEYSVAYRLDTLNEEDIVKSLKSIKNVISIETVSKNNDPNQLLDKEHGYVSCVYFSLDLIDQTKIPGTSVIKKGTDCGGCIELYSNVEDANNRINYLSQFDNSLLYSGSYAIIGKSVIRASYLLDNQQQITITNQICEALISQ